MLSNIKLKFVRNDIISLATVQNDLHQERHLSMNSNDYSNKLINSFSIKRIKFRLTKA